MDQPLWAANLQLTGGSRVPSHLLGAALDVGGGLGHLGEHAGGLAHVVGAHLAPGDLLGLRAVGREICNRVG